VEKKKWSLESGRKSGCCAREKRTAREKRKKKNPAMDRRNRPKWSRHLRRTGATTSKRENADRPMKKEREVSEFFERVSAFRSSLTDLLVQGARWKERGPRPKKGKKGPLDLLRKRKEEREIKGRAPGLSLEAGKEGDEKAG